MIFDCMVMYNVHTGVMMAARSLLQLFREKNPALLLKKDRVSNHGNHCPCTRKIKSCVLQAKACCLLIGWARSQPKTSTWNIRVCAVPV